MGCGRRSRCSAPADRGPPSKLPDHRGYLGREVVRFLFDPFAHLVPGEPSDGDVLFYRRDLLGHQLAYGLARVLHEWLIYQNVLFVKLVEPALDDLPEYLFGFAGV